MHIVFCTSFVFFDHEKAVERFHSLFFSFLYRSQIPYETLNIAVKYEYVYPLVSHYFQFL